MQYDIELGVEERLEQLSTRFQHWEKIKDVIDQLLDIMLDYRQSGHPGGSRSKVHVLVATLLSGLMRWDIRHPEKRFGDRVVLVAGHTNPVFYVTLAVLNEVLRTKFRQTGDKRYEVPNAEHFALVPEDLLTLRRHGGLPGHAEMAGKTLFFKFNTGPSGHGSPPAAGEAFALKYAGAEGVKVFAFEGEGGLTAGASHETKNSAWGLGLNNMFYVLDWNDFGIDEHPVSSVVHGAPKDWFEPYGWRVVGCEHGEEWPCLTRALIELVGGANRNNVPSVMWYKSRKGRGYGVYDYKSHGTPHKRHSELFWQTTQEFTEKYGVEFEGYGRPAPEDPTDMREEAWTNMQRVLSVLVDNQELVDDVANTLVRLGDAVPEDIPSFWLTRKGNPLKDERLYDYRNYPPEMYLAPGASAPNRAALAKWGAWVNAFSHDKYDRPVAVALSADLAESTNIAGFSHKWGDFPGYGVFDRNTNLKGTLLPQEITEFTNAGMTVGIATVNFSKTPYEEFDGLLAACSTYASFSYLKYGLFRLFAQLAQDSEIQVGKVIWVAGHSGPETAEDSRTHFGIFSPGVTQLFPRGHVIDLHPWEHNEVPVVLGAALREKAHIIALHLTRPAITIPDRAALGMPSHFEAARGAYVMRDYRSDQRKMGTVIVRGTSTTDNLVKVLPELDKSGLNVKIVAAISIDLFRLQPKAYQDQVLSPADWADSMVITNGARRLMQDWLPNHVAEGYSLSSDWDDRWRTGGSVDEVLAEAHLSQEFILKGIERFVRERESRLRGVIEAAEEALGR